MSSIYELEESLDHSTVKSLIERCNIFIIASMKRKRNIKYLEQYLITLAIGRNCYTRHTERDVLAKIIGVAKVYQELMEEPSSDFQNRLIEAAEAEVEVDENFKLLECPADILIDAAICVNHIMSLIYYEPIV